MKYAGIIKNDTAAGEGVCVSFYTQGCPFRCDHCHNPQTWDFNGGKEFTQDTITEIIQAIKANGIIRNFCILGGEPLCPENQFLTHLVLSEVKKRFPQIKIYIWTGYTYETLPQDDRIKQILSLADYLIDGPYMDNLRDITLPMRGSSNQRIIDLTSIKNYDMIKEKKENLDG